MQLLETFDSDGIKNKNRIKANKLIGMAKSVIHANENRYFFQSIIKKFNLQEQHFIEAFLDYNLDITKPEGNEIYHAISNRIVLHIHNLLKGSWHEERQKTVVELLKTVGSKNIADIGFGVPSRYVKDYVLQNKRVKLTLCDKFDSAFQFGNYLCNYWDINFEKQIRTHKTDFDSNDYVGDFDMYIFQDAIEHAKEPKKLLNHYVKSSPADALFLISLPIGPIFPRHFIAWHSNEEAIKWVESVKLTVIEARDVYVNKSVDLFAEQLSPDYHDMYLLAGKNDELKKYFNKNFPKRRDI